MYLIIDPQFGVFKLAREVFTVQTERVRWYRISSGIGSGSIADRPVCAARQPAIETSTPLHLQVPQGQSFSKPPSRKCLLTQFSDVWVVFNYSGMRDTAECWMMIDCVQHTHCVPQCPLLINSHFIIDLAAIIIWFRVHAIWLQTVFQMTNICSTSSIYDTIHIYRMLYFYVKNILSWKHIPQK